MVGGNGLPKIGMSYAEGNLEPGKQAETPAYHPGPRPITKPRKSQNVLKHSVAEVEECSL